jgi:hypothetical protein
MQLIGNLGVAGKDEFGKNGTICQNGISKGRGQSDTVVQGLAGTTD